MKNWKKYIYIYVGSRFSDWAHYNEFCKEWVQKLGSDKATARSEDGGGKGKTYGIGRPKGSREKGPLARRLESSTLLASLEPLPLLWASLLTHGPPLSLLAFPSHSWSSSCSEWSLLLYIPLFRSSSSYTCQSSMPILKCTSHWPYFLALCELLWPPSPCPESHPHQWGQGVSCGYLIRRWRLLLELSLHHSPMASLYDLESLFVILEWIASGDLVLFSPMILSYWGEGCPRQYNLVVWIPFIRPRTLLLARRGPWAWY